MCRRVSVAAALAFALALTPVLAAATAAPPAYRTLARRPLGPGVDHLTMRRAGPAEHLHVLRVSAGSPFALRSIAASGSVAPERRLERTSSICRRLDCVAAVNGDFWMPKTGEVIGGLVSDGQLLRSPATDHAQIVLTADGALSTNPFRWSGTLLTTDLRSLSFSRLNVPRGRDDLTLYTPAYGNSTRTSPGGVEAVLDVRRPAGPLRLGRTSLVRVTAVRRAHDTPIPRNGAVLSASGRRASTLAALWSRIRSHAASKDALLRLESPTNVAESIGGSPVLVRNGRPVFADVATNFVRGRHPRTLVGRTVSGDLIIVTVDGRQPRHSDGMTLAEAADLMIDLGASDAINLDGGGSTTFVVRGNVVNRPSDRLVRRGGRQRIVNMPDPSDAVIGNVERPVASALVLLPRGEVSRAEGAVDISRLHIPTTVDLPAAQSSDPASDPSGRLAAIVYRPGGRASPSLMILAALTVGLALFVLVVFSPWRPVRPRR